MSKITKPPDKYVTVKCPLNLIIHKQEYKANLIDACFRTNQLVIHSYQFLRLWILQKYHNKLDIPIITENTIKMSFKALTLSSQGPKPKDSNGLLLDEFEKFYDDTYKKLGLENKIDGSYLSQILNSMATDMLTNIENNVKMHFFKYVNRFVNSSYKKTNNDLIEKGQIGKKTELRKQLSKEIYDVKQDLLNNTLKSNVKYNSWINKHRNNIFPIDFVNSYEFDVQNNPQKYIKSMIYMCEQIEKIETKSYQFFPLRTDITMKFIPIDTKSLIEIYVRENKKELLDDIEGNKEKLWNIFFNIDNSVFKQSNYVFDYKIYTDCYSVSIQMLHNDKVEDEKEMKLNKKNKKKEYKEKTKDMTKEEKEQFKIDEEERQKKEQEAYKLKIKEQKDKEKEAFKNLPKEEQKRIIDERKKEKDKKKIECGLEFPYLEDLNNTQLEELKNNNWITCDPGKKCLLYMKNKEGITYRYSNKKHVHYTKRLKYQRLIQNYKDKNNISKVENELTNYNSRTCKVDKFKDYIKNKNRINSILFEKYNNEIFRKYKWYGYLNRKKTEAKMLKEIKEVFGKDSIICFGDWSMKCGHKGNMSSPNIRLKRLLSTQIKVYNLDEFRTSKLNYKTEEESNNLYLPDKNKKIRKLHSVLTYKMENGQIGCINRDKNAVNNMIKIVKYYLENKKRPIKYCRSIEPKGVNPSILTDTISTTNGEGQVTSIS